MPLRHPANGSLMEYMLSKHILYPLFPFSPMQIHSYNKICSWRNGPIVKLELDTGFEPVNLKRRFTKPLPLTSWLIQLLKILVGYRPPQAMFTKIAPCPITFDPYARVFWDSNPLILFNYPVLYLQAAYCCRPVC